MKDQTKQSTIEEDVLERIRSGQLTMRSKSFFIATVSFTIILSLLVLIVSIWLASFISFGLRITGHESLLGFGSRGLALFLSVFPWGLAVLDLALITLLVWVLQRFRFVYRTPILIILAILVAIGTGSGLLLDRETGFHDGRFEKAEAGELPVPLQDLYENARPVAPEDQGIYRGYVTRIVSGSFLMTYDDHDQDGDEGMWVVIPPSGFDTASLRIGDKVYVAGDRDGKTIEAYGVRTLAQ